MKKYVYKTAPEVCSEQIVIEMEDEKIVHVEFVGGCAGSLQAVARLVEGAPLEEAAAKLRSINCGGKGTSCPDQLATALLKIHAKLKSKKE